MQLAMIGLGRMGADMVRRLMADGHECVVYDINKEPIDELAAEGATPAYTLDELVAAMTPPRSVWVMIPAAFVGSTVRELAPKLDADDTIIDGGNSMYQNDVDLAEELADAYGIHYVDCGTSGGVFGLERGYCLMIGGDDVAVERLHPVFDSLAPGVDAAERTPGRTGDPTPEERGWLHCGPTGAGHFVKMIHNGIEYGIMAAYAEGMNILANADIGKDDRPKDAETAPIEHAKYFRYDLDLPAISEVWRRGSVITSWLLDLTAEAYYADPKLDEYSGYVSDSGEGRWSVQAAVEEGVPAPVLSAALFQRFSSRNNAEMADKVLSAMRAGFGGHKEKTAEAE